SLPVGSRVVRGPRGADTRTIGSGNNGAANVRRPFGPKYGLPVPVLDTAQGFSPAHAANLVSGHRCGVLAGGAAMHGHRAPRFPGRHRALPPGRRVLPTQPASASLPRSARAPSAGVVRRGTLSVSQTEP